MKKQENGGEGNCEADRRYREGAEKACDISRDDLKKSRKAEEKAKSRAKT